MKRYPKYKDSGSNWIDEIPEHWGNVQLKRGLESIKNGTTKTQVDYITNYPVSRIETISSGKIDFNRVGYLEKGDIEESYILNKGDIILSHINSLKFVGNCAIYDSTNLLIHGMNLLRLKPNNKVISKYLLYYLKSYKMKNQIQAYSKHAINQVSLTTSSLKSSRITFPSIPEQQTVADYLDLKTGQIDALIKKKEKQVALLKEYRTAVITHAVTKGLDPDVRMKGSGVEWIGEIPEHWEVKPLFSLMPERKEKNDGNRIQNVLSLSYGNIIQRDISDNFGLIPASFKTYQIIYPGDIVLRLTDLQNDKRSLRSGLVNEKGIITSAYLCLKSSHCIDISYRHYLFHGYDLMKIFYSLGGGVRQSLRFFDLKRLPILYPPLQEQQTIANYLDNKTAKIDKSIQDAEGQIGLLKEYRTALISNVVTGKIDVREEGTTTKPVREANPYFKRAVLAAEIVDQFHSEPTFGRVKLQKVLHLCQYHAELSEIESDYHREAAGPFDNRLIRSVENQLNNSKWFRVERKGSRNIYIPLKKAGGHTKYFDRYWGGKHGAIQKIIDLLKLMTTQQCEIVSTLYAAWNDIIISAKRLQITEEKLMELLSDEKTAEEALETYFVLNEDSPFDPELNLKDNVDVIEYVTGDSPGSFDDESIITPEDYSLEEADVLSGDNIRVNGEAVDLDHVLEDGDMVTIVPPVRGASLSPRKVIVDVGIKFGNIISKSLRNRKYRSFIGKQPNVARVLSLGDSWFQYPGMGDIIDHLLGFHPVYSLDGAGNDIVSMFDDAEFFEKIREESPKFFLISGGGNDIFNSFKFYLKEFSDVEQKKPGEEPERFISNDYSIKMRQVRDAYNVIIDLVTTQSQDVNIIVHGYTYVIPRDGGTWLGEPMIHKGITNEADQKAIANLLIDNFHNMLDDLLSSNQRYANRVTHIDLRDLEDLPDNPYYWKDEIHPNTHGFRKIATKYHGVINSIKRSQDLN
jgi:type I restriction enzyme S subunit